MPYAVLVSQQALVGSSACNLTHVVISSASEAFGKAIYWFMRTWLWACGILFSNQGDGLSKELECSI